MAAARTAAEAPAMRVEAALGFSNILLLEEKTLRPLVDWTALLFPTLELP